LNANSILLQNFALRSNAFYQIIWACMNDDVAIAGHRLKPNGARQLSRHIGMKQKISSPVGEHRLASIQSVGSQYASMLNNSRQIAVSI
jgi:hypothetical protein